ncbi:spore germination protein GerXC [Neobacillus ginsengisoli]|uniref:Ger(X)C family germination protein n=1 Tax=Neobacillus ginsengisoli TaxID=904295 RepID=A0ABT9Y4G8_9BACI|nr:Ger(x)C family spore germination protein [Neobacillus ginsengisoli]MDQ0202019.1 Ger(x)C family germination protein [Neobacillus ginsengisoli]
MKKIPLQQKLLMVFASIFLLTGCWDTREVEHVWYINALGIDFQDNRYVIYPQLINFSTFAKQEGSANRAPQPIFIGKGSGEILDHTAFDFYRTAQQQVSWEHIKTIVFSENVLKNGDIRQIDEFLARFFQFRNRMWVFGTKESIQDVLATGTILNISPLYTVMDIPNEMTKNYSLFSPLKFFKFRANFYEPGMTTQIPYLSIEKKRWKSNKKDFPLLKYSGTAFVASKRYKGYMSEKDLTGLKWTDKMIKRAPIQLKRDGEPVAEIVLKKPKIKIQPYIKDHKPHFRMKLSFEGDIFQIVKYLPVKTLESLSEQMLQKEVKRTYTIGLKKEIDVYQLSQILYRNNVESWKKHEKHGVIPLSPSSLDVDVKVQIMTSGQWKPTNLKKPFSRE